MFDEELLFHLLKARQIGVLTGAGISAESGIPTFREAQTGLWSQYEPTELATPEAFQRNPTLVWDWYAWRKDLIKAASPNSGHYAIKKISELLLSITLITQNVDNLHQDAGCQDVIELHGNIFRTRCSNEGIIITDWEKSEASPPKCPQCGAFLRPDVVWFAEGLPLQALNSAVNVAASADVFFSIGTSAMVHPAASLPRLAYQSGAITIEINPALTPISHLMTYTFQARAGEILPELANALEKLM